MDPSSLSTESVESNQVKVSSFTLSETDLSSYTESSSDFERSSSNDVDDTGTTNLLHLRKRRVLDDDDDEKRKKIIVGTTTIVIGAVAAQHNKNVIMKEPSHDWELERRCFLSHLYNGKESDCIEQLRISRNGFANLCNVLQEKGGLMRTKHVSVKEAVAMFLHILAHNLEFRVIQFAYNQSKETISRQFNSVLLSILKVSSEYLKMHECILDGPDADKWKWFENCIGALDGTHIPVTVSAEDGPRYRNRKGDLTTNVLGVCAPDLRYIYVLPGWEGSASDSRVLQDALSRRHCFHIPNDKYCLVDAVYTNRPGFLAPYRKTRYHLNEWIGNTPKNYKELFNLRHSIARNTIERSFGLLKKRWSILRTPSFFDIKTQVRIINACVVLHNFIRLEQKHDPVLEAQDMELLDSVDQEISKQRRGGKNVGNASEGITRVNAADEWTTFRETLAMRMFAEYQARQQI